MMYRKVQMARDYLNEKQRSDGGWGYRIDSASNTESTAAALIAQLSQSAWEKGVAWLLSTQKDDGGWGMNRGDDEANWLTAWAVWALLNASTEEALSAARRGLDWLLEMPAVRTEDPRARDLLRVDGMLAGWAWQPGGTTWVEPNLDFMAWAGMGHADATRINLRGGNLSDLRRSYMPPPRV